MDSEKYIYFGNIYPTEAQYESDLFLGLALRKRCAKEIEHDARSPLPFSDNSVVGFQSQDVFEHIEYERIIGIFDEIYRCLRPGGLFRLSMPDYHSPLLKSRSVYDHEGKILCDLTMGGKVKGKFEGGLDVSFGSDGESHLWFPVYANVLHLIVSSHIRKCATIVIQHAWTDANNYICRSFDQSIMPVIRTPPRDMRAKGKPISMVIDFLK